MTTLLGTAHYFDARTGRRLSAMDADVPAERVAPHRGEVSKWIPSSAGIPARWYRRTVRRGLEEIPAPGWAQ